VLLDPSVTITSNAGMPPIQGSATIVQQRLPAIYALPAGPGLTLNCSVFAPAGDVAVWFLSSPADPVSAGHGTIWIDLGSFFIVASVVLPGTQHAVLGLPVPNDPGLRGRPLVLQAFGASLVTPWHWSNPVEFVLD
jgi:hypothetical protein